MGKRFFRVRASGTKFAMTEKLDSLTSGTVGAQVQVDYSEEWKDLRRTAVFRAGGVTRDVYGVGDFITIPSEVLKTYGLTLEMGMLGESDDGKLVIPTMWVNLDRIRPGADPSKEEGYEPPPSLWQQMCQMIGDMSKLTTEARQNLVVAINEAAKSGGSVSAEEVLRIVEECLKEQEPDGAPATVSASVPLAISLAQGDAARISFVTSKTTAGDLFLLINGAEPDSSGYSFAGSISNFEVGQIGYSGSSFSAVVDLDFQFHGSDLIVMGRDLRGNGSGCGQSILVWRNVGSVQSLTFSAPGTVVVVGMSLKALRKAPAVVGSLTAQIVDGVLVVDGDITAQIVDGVLVVDGSISASVVDHVLVIKEEVE